MHGTTGGRPIIIVGGGAAGLELAIRLVRTGRSTNQVMLIDRFPTHVWKPRLHEISAGLLVADDEEASFTELAAQHGFSFQQGEMCSLNPDARTISLTPVVSPDARIGEIIAARSFDYETVILAIGSTVNDFGIAGVEQHCFTLDTAQGAQQLNIALLACATRVHGGRKHSLRVAIVGAGTTGVELAGELRHAVRTLPAYRSVLKADQLKLVLVEMADRPLPALDLAASSKVRRSLELQEVEMHFGMRVQRVDRGTLHLADNTRIRADLLVWASGIKGQRVAQQIPGIQLSNNGRIEVDNNLRVTSAGGGQYDSFYCIGDCAAAYAMGSTTPLGATAQVARQQARYLARYLPAQCQGARPPEFHFQDRGTLVSLGGRLALGDLHLPGRDEHGFSIEGLTAKIAYLALYRAHSRMMFGWWRTLLSTISSVLHRASLPSVKLRW